MKRRIGTVRGRACAAVAGLALILLGNGAQVPAQARGVSAGPSVIAHRGGVVDGDHGENSLGALAVAIRQGYSHVEVDVRGTKDGQVVCLHDRSLRRTTGVDIDVDQVTLEQLYKLVSPSAVPTFEAFARQSAAGHLNLMVDIKEVPEPLAPAFARSIENTLKRHGLLKGALLIGQKDVIRPGPGRPRIGWRKSFATFQRDVLARGGRAADYFAFNHSKDFTEGDIAGFHRSGVDVIVTVNLLHYPAGDPVALGKADIAKAKGLGVDGYQIDSIYEPYLRSIIGNK